MGEAVGLSGQVGGDVHFTDVNGQGGEFVGKAEEGAIEFFRAKSGFEMGEGLRHDLWVGLLAVLGEGEVEHFVNQAEGVDLSRADGLFGEVDEVARFVDALGEEPRSVEVGEDDIPVGREEVEVELVTVAGGAGKVEGEHNC